MSQGSFNAMIEDLSGQYNYFAALFKVAQLVVAVLLLVNSRNITRNGKTTQGDLGTSEAESS